MINPASLLNCIPEPLFVAAGCRKSVVIGFLLAKTIGDSYTPATLMTLLVHLARARHTVWRS